ncbi:uncharacterized protein LOC123513162 isoform X2 [Portunus trituberculatus]|uniref:uncharacterized protein LOC123513162 isoform X2 n=1 Tax=Portunus trituberculatus TaxID=210409 RepID=UPI001E1CE02A|nr:uncharacterized protein LOC123513162 isoform X2 [Portunus trituberculatus]
MACHGVVFVMIMVTLAMCILTPLPGEAGRVFNFQPNNQPTTSTRTWLFLQPPESGEGQDSVLSNLSVCLRFFINFFRESTYVFSYATSDKSNNDMNMGLKKNSIFIALGSSYKYGLKNMSYVPGIWYHACFVVNVTSFLVYLDGELQREGTINERSILMNGSLVLGQETDLVNGGFQEQQSFCGMITDFNLYSRALTSDEVEGLATCTNTTEEGDVVAWSSTQWTIEGEVEDKQLQEEEYCVKRTRFTVFPELRRNREARQWCVNHKSMLAVPRSAEENERLYAQAIPFLNQCRPPNHAKGFFWLGATDKANNGVWTDLEGVLLNYTNFGGRDKSSKKECAIYLIPPQNQGWDDSICTNIYKFCSACMEETPAVLKMRGLCEDEDLKAAWFTFHQQPGKKPSFKGFTKYIIEPDDKEETSWRLVNQWTNTTLALLHTHDLHYPTGTRQWQLLTDYEVCGKSKDTEHLLSLSACYAFEFTCGDGTCLNLSQRCDLRVDCPDNTDEIGCEKLVRPKDYLSSLTPAGVEPGPLALNLSLQILGFSEINLRDLKLTVDLATTLSWYDQRLKYRNLKAIREINHIPPLEVWTPKVEYMNADFPRISTTSPILNVVRQTEPEPDDPSAVLHDEIYLGESNPLRLSQKVNAPFTCNMNLRNFPFDTQHCSMLLRLSSARSNFLTWADMNVTYLGEALLTEYEVGTVLAAMQEEDRYSVAMIQITFYRRFWFYITSAYLPTIMLMFISYASLFCKRENSDLRVMMSLTTLLVLYALYQQISDGLPRTSYTKAIDVWCFFAITLIFATVIFHVFIDVVGNMRIRRRRHVTEDTGINMWAAVGKAPPEGADRLMLWARGGYAGVVVLFVVVYWSVVLANMDY